MKFRSDNKIRYGQDRFQHQGIPSGVDFRPAFVGKHLWRLVGCGYGCLVHGNCYGNGALYPWGLTARQRKRFEKAGEAAKGEL